MLRSVALAIALALLCASQPTAALDNAAAAPGCASGACFDSGSDETVLIQTKIQEHRHQATENSTWDLGNLTNSITDAITGAVGTVTNGVTDAVTGLAETAATGLEEMKDDLASIVQKVNNTEEVIESGVATILSDAYGLVFQGISVGEGYAEKTMAVLKLAESAWSAVVEAIQSLSEAIDSSLSLIGSSADGLKQAVDAALQVVLSGAEGALKALETVEGTLANLTSNATSAEAEKPASRRSAALLQAKPNLADVLDALNAGVGEFSTEAGAVGEAISDVIGNITSEIPAIVKDIVGADNMAKVSKAMADLQTAATDLANEVVDASNLLSGITEVTAAAADALRSQATARQSGTAPAARPPPGFSLAALAAAAALAARGGTV